MEGMESEMEATMYSAYVGLKDSLCHDVENQIDTKMKIEWKPGLYRGDNTVG